MPPFSANQGTLLAFLRPPAEVQKGERPNVLGILCVDLDSAAFMGTCLTEEALLQTWAYADIKKASQRYAQLSEAYDVDKETTQLRLLFNQFVHSVDFAQQVGNSEENYKALAMDKGKRCRGRSSAMKVIISGTQEEHHTGNEKEIDSTPQQPTLPLRAKQLKVSKLSLSAQRSAKKISHKFRKTRTRREPPPLK